MATRTAFVLAGGGSFGAVQAGMLRALVAHGVVPDLVVGSSVGALNGAYFAGTPDAQGVAQLEAIWRGLRRAEVLPLSWRSLLGLFEQRNFLVDPGRLRRIIEERLPYRELEQAAVPLHVVATDLIGGGPVRLSSGPAAEAVLASCAIPAAFPPVRIGERYLIDGAVAANTPISAAARRHRLRAARAQSAGRPSAGGRDRALRGADRGRHRAAALPAGDIAVRLLACRRADRPRRRSDPALAGQGRARAAAGARRAARSYPLSAMAANPALASGNQ
jgi:predicted acylesterase/phospholipase RssA